MSNKICARCGYEGLDQMPGFGDSFEASETYRKSLKELLATYGIYSVIKGEDLDGREVVHINCTGSPESIPILTLPNR